jgi:hypothetical protein
MATRSRIAIEKEDGKVESIYCHFDGYPKGNGKLLLDFYSDRVKARDLINLGNISYLAPNLEPQGKHSFNDPEPGTVLAYGRDRGETTVKKYHSSVSDFFNGDIEEWGYLLTQEGEWLCKKAYGDSQDPVAITYILSGEVEL